MAKLKVGDEVFIKRSHRWNGVSYHLSEVERLTKTRAILKCGIQLINEPKSSNWGRDGVFFEEHGDRYEKWNIPTKEDLEEMNNFNYQRKITSWYRNNKDLFTFDQIESIYNLITKK